MTAVSHRGSIRFADDDDTEEMLMLPKKPAAVPVSRSAEAEKERKQRLANTMRELDSVASNVEADEVRYKTVFEGEENDDAEAVDVTPGCFGNRRSERPYLSFFLFGYRVTYITRRSYDRLPPLQRKLIDNLFSLEKRD
jgi:hypothetical protein